MVEGASAHSVSQGRRGRGEKGAVCPVGHQPSCSQRVTGPRARGAHDGQRSTLSQVQKMKHHPLEQKGFLPLIEQNNIGKTAAETSKPLAALRKYRGDRSGPSQARSEDRHF